MQVEEAISQRRSVRQYLPRQVEKDKLQRLLKLSQRAPTWKNAQAYRIYAVQGESLQRISQQFIAEIEKGTPEHSDFPYQEGYPSYIRKRMMELGKSYFSYMGVDRKDKEKRKELFLKNYMFFGAPCALFFFMEKGMEYWPTLDLGILLGNIMLAARAEGLETIAQASLAAFPEAVKQELKIEENWNLAVGMSIGYEDTAAKINNFPTERAGLSEVVDFIGFD